MACYIFRLFSSGWIFGFFVAAFFCGCSHPEKGGRIFSSALSEFDALYLSRPPPPLGEVYIVDISGESYGRSVLATTLQGVVNRHMARVYLLTGKTSTGNRDWEKEGERAAEEFWVQYYSDNYGLKVVWEGGLEEALEVFAGEIEGYVLVSRDEPWTVNAGTTIAALENVVVAFPEDQEFLEGLGIPMYQSLVGRWQSASECYLDLWKMYYARMPHRGLGILNPDEYRLRDFLIQQGFLTVYGRPTTDEWLTLVHILRRTAVNVPVFGYLSMTGEEEVLAVMTLSQYGKYLIPSDTTPNLSFHVAVTSSSREGFLTSIAERRPKIFPECETSAPVVTVAISDGDNLVIPLNRYIRESQWRSPERGRLPVGWSFSLAVFAVAPAVAEYFVNTATEADELVAMLGVGYAFSYFYPDRAFFLSHTFRKMSEQNISTFWVLDPPLYLPSCPAWTDFTRYAVQGYPSGMLVGYLDTGTVSYFKVDGMPVLVAGNSYYDTPPMLAQRVQDFVNTSAERRPPVLFLGAPVWKNTYAEMLTAFAPLMDQGVHFLRPADALACIK